MLRTYPPSRVPTSTMSPNPSPIALRAPPGRGATTTTPTGALTCSCRDAESQREGGLSPPIVSVLVPRDADGCNDPDKVTACAGRSECHVRELGGTRCGGYGRIEVKDRSIGYSLKFDKGIKRTG
jgi:hypothetical protein